MIPKTIHYCWFGKNPKPEIAKECICSWKKYCPSYEIVEWNEDNYDISLAPIYVQQAYKAKKWAFVTDYVRLDVIYKHGGIYLDTDVELKKPLDDLLTYNAYFGFERGNIVATGLGFGAIKGFSFIKDLMSDYLEAKFINDDGSLNTTTCSRYNLKHFVENGLLINDKKQVLKNDILVLPSIYFAPINLTTGKYRHSKKTYSVHWYSASWFEERFCKDKFREIRKHYILKKPNEIMMKILGIKRYEKIKRFLKR